MKSISWIVQGIMILKNLITLSSKGSKLTHSIQERTLLCVSKSLILDMAAANGHLEAAKILINNKINLNLTNESGNTALRI